MLNALRRLVIYTAIILLGGVLGANVYNSVVDATNWGSAIPGSIEAARHYFTAANPGTFFRTASPFAQISSLVALIAIWPAGLRARLFAAAALVFSFGGEMFTYTYFFPRNAIMFGADPQTVETLREAWSGWSTMNWLRSGVCLAAVICELGGLSALESHFGRRLAPRIQAE